MNKKVKHGTLLTVIFTLLSLLYLYPIILVFINSFKKKVYISKAPFEIPTGKMYVGLENYIRGIKQTRLIQAFGWSLFITILSVAVIILCCSMCAWYICRVKYNSEECLGWCASINHCSLFNLQWNGFHEPGKHKDGKSCTKSKVDHNQSPRISHMKHICNLR